MNIALQFAMPAELHALPGARDLPVVETVAGIPFFQAAPGVLACAGRREQGQRRHDRPNSLPALRRGFDSQRRCGRMPHRSAHRVSGGCLGICPARCGHHGRGRSHRTGVHRQPGGLPHLAAGTLCRAACRTGVPRLHRPGATRRLVRRPGASGPPGCGTPSPPCWWRWKAAPSPRSACATACASPPSSPVSDHLFSDNQAQEYFDFGEALERLGKIVLPLALKLKEEA